MFLLTGVPPVVGSLSASYSRSLLTQYQVSFDTFAYLSSGKGAFASPLAGGKAFGGGGGGAGGGQGAGTGGDKAAFLTRAQLVCVCVRVCVCVCVCV
jgi:hypothetical protein